MIRSITLVFTLVVVANVRAEKIKSPIVPGKCLVYFDFAGGNHNLGASGGEVRLNHELKRDLAGGSLHFASDRQYAELDAAGMGELSRRLADVPVSTAWSEELAEKWWSRHEPLAKDTDV